MTAPAIATAAKSPRSSRDEAWWGFGIVLLLVALIAAIEPAGLSSAFDALIAKSMNGELPLPLLVVVLAAGTFVSEDLACISAGLLVGAGQISFTLAAVACAVGIWVGDVGLYLGGRFAGWLAGSKWREREAIAKGKRWLDQYGTAVIFASRFLPGARLPIYTAAGALRFPFVRFASWLLVAAAAWTPLIVGSVNALDGLLVARDVSILSRVGLVAAAALSVLVALRFAMSLADWRRRRLLLSRWRRWTRWEFWPPWVFYAPVVAYVSWLAIRHRSLMVFTAANPLMKTGGLIGESKYSILEAVARSDSKLVPETALIEDDPDPSARVGRCLSILQAWQAEFPVVLKPDVGQRGSGVRIVGDEGEVADYFQRSRGDVILQRYVPGLEFGLFYVRMPGSSRGRIFSITEKRSPFVIGDGVSRLEELILADDRAVCMAPTHLASHASELDLVLPKGQRRDLVALGTHCRGSVFTDGMRHATPALVDAIDLLSRGVDGFFFGRYDVRVPTVEDLEAGRNLGVIELNGVSSEATAIYDPSNTLLGAYRTLFEQWRLAFAVGEANRRLGAKTDRLVEVVRQTLSYLRMSRHHAIQ